LTNASRGATTFDECVATAHDAVAAGINLLDLAPRYGDGKAEEVVGEAFGGCLPDGVRVTSKCNLGEPVAYQIDGILRRSIEESLKRLRLSRLDLFFLHSNVVPDAAHIARHPDAAARMTLYTTFCPPCAPGLLAPGRGRDHRRLGPYRNWLPRHDYQAARRHAGSGGGAMHRQPARLTRRPQIL
jgi:hypothetical protein